LAPLGFGKGLAAIILGHVIGCALLFFAAYIGSKTERSSMQTAALSFGGKGAAFFSILNVLQLVGWTAVMVNSGAIAAASVASGIPTQGWALIIGALIALWVLVRMKALNKINIVAMGGLFVLSIILSSVVFKDTGIIAGAVADEGSISFGAGVELSVAMPLSWLPLVADYTRNKKRSAKPAVVSALTYFAVSCWMYAIGMGAAIFTGETDIAGIMVSAGYAVAALLIVVFSTVTTTFLDVYSSGVSAESIWGKLRAKPVALIACALGTALAILTPITELENFLYLIGSVFAPMIAILIADFFFLKKNVSDKQVNIANAVIWALGFILYRVFMQVDTPLGSTLPVMVIIVIVCVVTGKIKGNRTRPRAQDNEGQTRGK
jgi:putative hydroxymethylpyrimidine transporter CytX